MTSWKTTVTGIAGILTGLAVIAKAVAAGTFDMTILGPGIAAVTSGFGLIFARDHNVTSEQAGAK